MIIIWDLLQPTFSTEIITEDAEFHEQNSNRTSWFFPKEIIKYQMNLLIHMNSLIHIKYQTAFQPLNIEFLWLLSMVLTAQEQTSNTLTSPFSLKLVQNLLKLSTTSELYNNGLKKTLFNH